MSNAVTPRDGTDPGLTSFGHASPMQNRTHKGGAVLWYLRKHSPMPGPYDGSDLERTSKAEAEPSKPASSTKVVATAAAAKSATAKSTAAKGLQAKLLHSALFSIGVELEEARRTDGAHAGKPMSARCREDLRQQYHAYADAECAQLRRSVAQREAEVKALKMQVEQMQRTVQATWMAAKSRTQRLRRSMEQSGSGFEGSEEGSVLSPGLNTLMRAKRRFFKRSSVVVYDAERADMSDDANTNFGDNLQTKISQQWNAEQDMRAALEEQNRLFQQQTIQRKANEAGLFGKHAEILQLRAQTLKAEARVTRLANDLRRVYRRLPEVVRQKLDQSALQREQFKEKELEGLTKAHRLDHFKWLSSEELQAHVDVSDSSAAEMAARAQVAERALGHGDAAADAVDKSIREVMAACVYLRDAWMKLRAQLPSTPSPGGAAREREDKESKESALQASDQVEALLGDAEMIGDHIVGLAKILRPDAASGSGCEQGHV